MDTFGINQILKDTKGYLGAFPRDKLPKPKTFPASLIINTDASNQSGEHWVAVFITKNKTGEYFDSFGLPPFHGEIRQFLNKNCARWTYNKSRVQSLALNSKACGQYCILFISYRSIGHSFKKFINIFKKPRINDTLAES